MGNSSCIIFRFFKYENDVLSIFWCPKDHGEILEPHDHIKVDHIYGIAPKDGILNTSYLAREWGLPKGLVLISGDGHWWIALDYRKRKEEPPVVYFESDGGFTIELAKNFDSFLTELCNWEFED